MKLSNWLVTALLIPVLAYGCESGSSSTDGTTSWLGDCDVSGDCSSGLACLCGVCTKTCASGAECAPLGASAKCAPAIVTESLCPGGVGEALCLAGCGPTTPCDSGHACVAGICDPHVGGDASVGGGAGGRGAGGGTSAGGRAAGGASGGAAGGVAAGGNAPGGGGAPGVGGAGDAATGAGGGGAGGGDGGVADASSGTGGTTTDSGAGGTGPGDTGSSPEAAPWDCGTIQGQTCGPALGVCASPVWTCEGGVTRCDWAGRVGVTAEICDNGLDDDCDGTVDNGCTCTTDPGTPCGSTVGMCGFDLTYCRGGQLVCGGGPSPQPQRDQLGGCSGGADTDCDGLNGECDAPPEGDLVCCAYPDGRVIKVERYQCDYDLMIGDATGTPPLTACDPTCEDRTNVFDTYARCAVEPTAYGCPCVGTERPVVVQTAGCDCQRYCGGGQWGSCSGAATGTGEICNGVDDDCDGIADDVEPYGYTQNSGRGCRTGAGECGVMTCKAPGSEGTLTCAPEFPLVRLTGCPDVAGATCGPALGVCPAPVWSCSGGVATCDWAGRPGLGVEQCGNAIDDDCDGTVDDGCACSGPIPVENCGRPSFVGNTSLCGGGSLACVDGKRTCTGFSLPTPSAPQTFAVETCGDYYDSDCDQDYNDCDTVDPGPMVCCEGPGFMTQVTSRHVCNTLVALAGYTAVTDPALCDLSCGYQDIAPLSQDQRCALEPTASHCPCTDSTAFVHVTENGCDCFRTCNGQGWSACWTSAGPGVAGCRSAELCNGLDDDGDGLADGPEPEWGGSIQGTGTGCRLPGGACGGLRCEGAGAWECVAQ